MHGSTSLFSLRPLEPNFVAAKPIKKTPSLKKIHELEAGGNILIERKENGHGVFTPVTGLRKRHVGIYSRGIQEWTEKFPSITDTLLSMNIPHDTMPLGEMTLLVDGVQNPTTFGRLSLSNPERAIALQKEYAPVHLSFFNIAVYKGKSVIGLPYIDRLEILQEMLVKCDRPNVSVVKPLNMTFEEAKALSISSKWEGLVLYDKHTGSSYRTDGGNIPRDKGSWKWKDYDEDDFVVTGWNPSTAPTHYGLIEDLNIAQYDPATGELVSWGKVGTGLSTDERRDLMSRTYHYVVEVEFERRTPNKRLIGAHILRVRDRGDKRPEDCVSPKE